MQPILKQNFQLALMISVGLLIILFSIPILSEEFQSYLQGEEYAHILRNAPESNPTGAWVAALTLVIFSLVCLNPFRSPLIRSVYVFVVSFLPCLVLYHYWRDGYLLYNSILLFFFVLMADYYIPYSKERIFVDSGCPVEVRIEKLKSYIEFERKIIGLLTSGSFVVFGSYLLYNYYYMKEVLPAPAARFAQIQISKIALYQIFVYFIGVVYNSRNKVILLIEQFDEIKADAAD